MDTITYSGELPPTRGDGECETAIHMESIAQGSTTAPDAGDRAMGTLAKKFFCDTSDYPARTVETDYHDVGCANPVIYTGYRESMLRLYAQRRDLIPNHPLSNSDMYRLLDEYCEVSGQDSDDPSGTYRLKYPTRDTCLAVVSCDLQDGARAPSSRTCRWLFSSTLFAVCRRHTVWHVDYDTQ
jgi:hypothetical protein